MNGQSVGEIGKFTIYGGKLLASADELRNLGFRVPISRGSGPGTIIAVSDIPGVTLRLDLKKQELYVTAGAEALVPKLLRVGEGNGSPATRRVIESGTGVTLNYDTVGTITAGQAQGSGSFELRGFSPLGVVSSQWLAFTGSYGATKKRTVRLDSAYSFADVNSLRRYILGDFIGGSLTWTRPVHLAGVQVRSDFSMRPDLVTFPLPSIAGSTSVPSTISVMTDGNLVVSNQVAAGPFEIPQLPVISGAGTISMTVTNAMGQQVTLTQPFYASSALLAQGLQTFAAQAGLVRRNWGSANSNYGKMAGTAVYRRGLTSRITGEVTVESTSGGFMAGTGGVLQVGSLGVINLAAAFSASSGKADSQFSAGAQRIGRKFSIGASALIAGRNYRDVAVMNGDGVIRKQVNAFSSLFLRKFGSIGAAYGDTNQDAPIAQSRGNAAQDQRFRVVSGNYSLQFQRFSIFAGYFKSIAGTSRNGGVQIGVNIPFRRRSSVDMSGSSDGTGQFIVQQSAAQVGDWGYLGYVSAGDSDREFGEVQYKSPVGLFTTGMDRTAGQVSLRVESQGALSFVDRALFPSNTIFDSFGVVDTSPVGHVHVLQENRQVGRTNHAGRLLVPDMRSFDLNRIAIEATDIPPDTSVNVASGEIRPQDRSGVVIRFPIKVSHSALLKLVDEEGAPLPLGSKATLRSTGTVFPVGYDGAVYVENLAGQNEITVVRPDKGRCSASFEYRRVPGDLPSIGPLVCKGLTP